MKKKKIINDPVYGFISINSDLIFDVIQHPYYQRLRRIKQLGLTGFVYPGALHTRFHHALGAMHLMSMTLNVLRNKGNEISDKEYDAALIAILLHDIGHGPFSHALEKTILKGVHHEAMSLLIMQELNKAFHGELTLAIDIFTNRYARKFFHELVSSQLDMDRLDYLQRDCFFTGVIEGKVGFDRIVRMLDVDNDRIVVEEKGIYSVENFLNARRLMYWQVYLHKTTVSTEQMLIQIIKRARYLAKHDNTFFCTPALKYFLKTEIGFDDFKHNSTSLKNFVTLDDFDVWGSIKFWQHSKDKILSELSNMLLERRLFKVELKNSKIDKEAFDQIKKDIANRLKISIEETRFFCTTGKVTNKGYLSNNQNILIKTKKGQIIDIAKASDLPNIEALSKIVKKFYLCHPKVLSL